VSNATKTPLVKWARLQQDLPTYEEISEWFSENNRSVGVVTGKVSNLFLLDFDFTKHPESKIFYESVKGRLPRTWVERTKSGGLHMYFKWTTTLEERQTNTTGLVATGVDTKGEGGYAKMAPSEGYSWINSPFTTTLAAAPEWLVSLLPVKGALRRQSQIRGAGSKVSDLFSQLKEGNRDHTFTKIAGGLRARGYNSGDMFELLRGKAEEVGFGLDELEKVCRSVERYEPRQSEVSAPCDVATFLQDMQQVKWIVPDIIARQAIGFIAGLPETMKTWLTIDLAIECARGGGMWLGRFPTESAKVLFIDQERFKGETQRRFRAVIAAKGIDPKDLGSNLQIRCGTTTRINLDHSYQAFRNELEEIRPDIVIVDSFATFHTTEENNRGEIQAVLERVKQLRNDFGCTFIFIDHESKIAFSDKDNQVQPSAFRMAGSVGKPAAAEFVMTVRRHDPDTSMVFHTKSTLASTVAPFTARVRDDGGKDRIIVEAF
jgi:hypothetical protein